MIKSEQATCNKRHATGTGFTLIELLVTIAIITSLMIVSIPAFGKYGDRQKLNQASEEVGALIRKTQNLALAPKDDKTEILDNNPEKPINAYGLNCAESFCTINEYFYNKVDKTAEAGKEVENYVPKDSEFNPGAEIVFQIPEGKIVWTNSDSKTIEMILKSQKIEKTKTITVYTETGQVEIKNN